MKLFKNKWIGFALVGVVGFGLSTVFMSTRTETDQDKDLFEISKNIRLLSGVYDRLNTYYVDEPQPGKLMKTGIDAMLASLDPYTVYIPESRIEDYRYMTTGQYGGIGSLIQSHGEYIIISEPYEDSPANKAGLKAGDKLLEVDGKSVVGKTVQEMSLYLKGGAGTPLTVKFDRAGVEQELTFNREEIKIPDVPYFGMLDSKTGYVKLNSFTKTASTEVGKAIRALRDSSGMSQLVFDLRGNGGGLLREAVNIVNFFIPKNELVVFTKGRLEEVNRDYKTHNTPFDVNMPVVVLMNGNSASASEIVAGSLQDLDRAVVIGTRSYGKGLVQQTKELEFGSIVKLTVAKYYTPSGRCIQKLDYSHRDDDGQVSKVADSLIASFKTTNGREVKDGRGIDPDILVEQKFSVLTTELLMSHHIFDYATQFARSNSSIAEVKAFHLTDAQFESFVTYVEGQEFNYTTDSKKLLEALKETAKEEKYLESSEAEFEALVTKLTPSLEEDMVRYEDEIRELLENEIVSRYYFSTGRVIHALEGDPNIKSALEVLNDKTKDNAILKGI
jgi:carboxyl-terminal processing protease